MEWSGKRRVLDCKTPEDTRASRSSQPEGGEEEGGVRKDSVEVEREVDIEWVSDMEKWEEGRGRPMLWTVESSDSICLLCTKYFVKEESAREGQWPCANIGSLT